MGVDGDPFPMEFGTNMVSVNMAGMPRTTLKLKIILEAFSRSNSFPTHSYNRRESDKNFYDDSYP